MVRDNDSTLVYMLAPLGIDPYMDLAAVNSSDRMQQSNHESQKHSIYAANM